MRTITIAAAQDLSSDIRREAHENATQGYYADANGLENLSDALDREIADALENGEDEIAVREDSELEAAADAHGA